jgi:GDPmannose 4,6-dehydratase
VVETAFQAVDLDWKAHVKQDARFMRPAEPLQLVGDPSRAHQVLGWSASTSFEELIRGMTLAELEG